LGFESKDLSYTNINPMMSDDSFYEEEIDESSYKDEGSNDSSYEEVGINELYGVDSENVISYPYWVSLRELQPVYFKSPTCK
jgi:hypothetical protein